MSTTSSDADLLQQIDQLLEEWEKNRWPSKAPPELEQRLREMVDDLTDDRHLAGLDIDSDRVAALRSVIDRSEFAGNSSSFDPIRDARARIEEQSLQIETARQVVADFETRLKRYKEENLRLTGELETLHGLEERHQALTEERDTLQEQLAEIVAAGDEETDKQTTTARQLAAAKGRITKLERQLAAKNDQLAELTTTIETASKEAAAKTATLDNRRRGLAEASRRIERLEQELKAAKDKRQTAQQKANEYEQQLGDIRSHLEELESSSKKAIDKARAEGRHEGPSRPPMMWIALTLVGIVGLWLALRATVGVFDGSWAASTLWAGQNIFLEWLLSVHVLLLVLLVSAALLLFHVLTESETGIGDALAALFWGVMGAVALLGILATLQEFTDAELRKVTPCINELGGTTISMGWSCDLDAAVGDRGERLEVVALTDDEAVCRSEAAAYLGMDRAALAELSPPLRVQLLPGLPGRPRPCVIDSADASHVVGFFAAADRREGACFSSHFFDPSLTQVESQVGCTQPWRYQTVGSLRAPDPPQVETSSIARSALCTQRFGNEFDLDVWRFVARLDAGRVVCGVGRADGTTHVGAIGEVG